MTGANLELNGSHADNAGARAHLELGVGSAVALTAAITATAVVSEAPDTASMIGTVTTAGLDSIAQEAATIAAHAVVFAAPLNQFLWAIIHTLEHPTDPDNVVYAWALLLSVAGVMYVRHHRQN